MLEKQSSAASKLTGVIDSLQAGRAIASLAVVASHAGIAAEAFSGPFWGAKVIETGYLGVDFFFVLSGFIIYHSTVGMGKTAGQYAKSRFRRVYLPYLPVGIGIAFIYSFLPQLSAGSLTWSWFPTLTLAPVSSGTALSVAWTLKHEILFYTIFGLGHFTGKLGLVLGMWCAAIIGASLAGLSPSIPLAPINIEFFMGIAAAILARRGWGPNWLFLASAAIFVMWLALGADRSLSPIAGFAFCLAILPLICMERLRVFSVPTWLTFLGAASYAIYLVHAPVISLAARLLHLNSYALLVTGILSGAFAGIAYHWLVERRLIAITWRNPFRPITKASTET